MVSVSAPGVLYLHYEESSPEFTMKYASHYAHAPPLTYRHL